MLDECEYDYELDIPEGLLPFEVICPVCNLAKNKHLDHCPNCTFGNE